MKRTDLDLATRALGGSVRAVNDEAFAPSDSLILPSAPVHNTAEFGPRGKIYDGWETRRRRTPGHDWAVVALGVPGVVHQVVVDTAFFRGNYPPEVSVEAAWLNGSPTLDELAAADWTTVVPRSAADGDTANSYPSISDRIFTHVRLNIFPDGGVARLRVFGTAMPDPRMLGGRQDLAAIHSGGDILECSNMFYSDARHVLHPGVARVMSDGWETSRRRTGGNDYLVVSLAGAASLSLVDVDTSYFLGNAPGRMSLSYQSASDPEWRPLLAESPVAPDSHNRFRVTCPEPVTAVRVDVYPDGGFSRLHLQGELTDAARRAAVVDWLHQLPAAAARLVLTEAGHSVPDSDDPAAAVTTLSDADTDALVW